MSSAPAAENALKIIEAISAESEPIGVSELSRRLGINKNMIFRVLCTLEECGWIYLENTIEKRYALTLKPFEIASKAASRLSVSGAAAPLLHELWQKTGESTYLGILHGDKVMYIQHLDSTKTVRVAGSVGGTYELNCSAPGKCLLAYQDEAFIDDYLKRTFKKNTANTLTDKASIIKELELVRKNRYATDNEEFSNGIICIAAPIFDYTGKAVATIGCSVSTVEYEFSSAVKLLKPTITESANQVSQRLGH